MAAIAETGLTKRADVLGGWRGLLAKVSDARADRTAMREATRNVENEQEAEIRRVRAETGLSVEEVYSRFRGDPRYPKLDFTPPALIARRKLKGAGR